MSEDLLCNLILVLGGKYAHVHASPRMLEDREETCEVIWNAVKEN